jgi:ribosomal protein S18 acetylase RimI-like enzyme
MDTITLGPARISDAQWIAETSRSLIEAGLPWCWTPRRVGALMRERESLVVVARAGHQLIGFALAQFGSESVRLALLGVTPTHQRKGVGQQLIRWVEESAVVAGLFTMRLEVRTSNASARRFYTSLGFSESGAVEKYYSGIEDAVRFTRKLGGA